MTPDPRLDPREPAGTDLPLESNQPAPGSTAAPRRPLPRFPDEWPMRPSVVFPAWMARYLPMLCIAVLVTLILSVTVLVAGRHTFLTDTPATPSDGHRPGGVVSDAESDDRPFADGKSGNVLIPWADSVQIIPASDIHASAAALADLKSGEVIASRKADTVIYPASMTKVMTLIVVVENLPREDCLKDTITVSREVYDKMKAAGASGVGFDVGETLTVEAMLYALMLKSDGIAACELARYVAGSEEDFVELMNQKAEKMGLVATHFENPTGLHHKNHKSTAREIASIMAYAMNMQLCRRVLMTQSYKAPCKTADGKTFHYDFYHNLIVTLFEKTAPNQPKALQVVAGKTGFTDESRYCLVTYAETPDGHGYVCVTANGGSYTQAIEDYLTIYNTYVKSSDVVIDTP